MPVVGESASSSRDTASSPPADAPMATIGMAVDGLRGPGEGAAPAAAAGSEAASLIREAAVTGSVFDFPMVLNRYGVEGFRVFVGKQIEAPAIEYFPGLHSDDPSRHCRFTSPTITAARGASLKSKGQGKPW